MIKKLSTLPFCGTAEQEARLKEVKEIKLDNIKSSILNQVFIQGVSVKEYAQKHNMSVKDVYNHIYLLRCKVKDKLNL